MPRFHSAAIARALLVLAMTPLNARSQKPASQRLQDLLSYVGSYVADGREYAVSVRPSTPMGPLLVLDDLATDEVRVLFPAAPDSFVAGPPLIRRTPPQISAAFERTTNRPARALRLAGAWFGGGVVATRVPVRTLPLTFRRGDVSFSGTIYVPPRATRTAIVLAHGSEDSDRYSFGPLSWVLANHGFVILAYDKRGTGESTGSWQEVGLDALAEDLLAAVRALRARRELPIGRVGLLGTSEGGWIAPLAASKWPDAAFVVALSGGATTKGETFIYKDRRRAEERSLTGVALDSVVSASQRTIDDSRQRVESNAAPTGFDLRVSRDPTADWQRFRGPVLSLGGEYDVLEDAPNSATRLRAILLDAHHRDFTIKVFPRAHHLLFLGETGTPSEFQTMRGIHQMVPGFWDVLLRWLEAHRG